MTDSNATYATSIFCRIPDRAGEKITFVNASGFFISGNREIYPKTQYTLTLDNSGEGTQILPCPDNTGDSAINWRVNLPSKESGTYTIAYSASTQYLDDILAAQSATADPNVITAVITAAIASKANKLPGGTEDNLFSIDANGDLKDSGKAAANVLDTADAAWAAAGRATVPDATDLVAVADLDGYQAIDADAVPGNAAEFDATGKTVDAGFAFGTAAAANTGDFDAAGSAATVQGNLNTHTGMTGTVVPRRLDHSALTYTNDLGGGGGGGGASTVNAYLTMSSGPTANSTVRRYVNSNRLLLGATSNSSVNWAVKNIFRCRFVLGTFNTEGIFRWMVGKMPGAAYGIGDAGYMVGFELLNGTLTYALYGNNTVPTQLPVSRTGNNITIISENGAVSWYANGVLAAQIGSGGPTGDRFGTINYEIQNGPTAAWYQIYIWSQSECW